MGRCTSPPPPLGQRGSRFRGPFFETNNISILTSIAYAKRMERHSVAKRIPAGSEDVDYWPTTNGFVAVEDEGDQGRQSLSIAPNKKLEDIKLAEQAADTAITFQTRLAPQRSVSPSHFLDIADHAPQKSLSPPPFFEMKDRRVGASRQLQRRPACSRQFVQRRSIKMDFLASRQLVQRRSIAKRIPAGSEDVDHCPTTNGFVAVEDEGDQGSQSLSIAPNKKVENIKLAEQAADTAITFQIRLAPHRSVSPPHLLDVAEHAPQKSISPPAFFEMKDRRVGASRQLQRRPACRCRPLASRQFVQRRSIKMDFLASRHLVQRRSIAKMIPAGSEDVDHSPTTNGFVAVEDEGDQGRQSLSIAPNIKLEDIKLAEQAADRAITFQTPLASQRSVSPPHFLDVAEHAPQRSISPPPFLEMKDRKDGAILAGRQLVQRRSIAKRIPAGSEDVDHWPTTNEFVAVKDEGDQEMQSLSIAPNIKLEDIKLAEQAADTAISIQTQLAPQRSVLPPHFSDVAEHAPQRSISPPHFFEMKDRRLGAILAGLQLVHRRYKPSDFPSLIKNGDGEERNYGTHHSSNASIGAIKSPYQEAPPPRSCHSSNASVGAIKSPYQEAPPPRSYHSSNASVGIITRPYQEAPPPKSTRPPLPPTTRTAVDFSARLALPPARRQTAKCLIASIFKKKKRQMETFAGSIEKEQSVEVEPGPTSFGLAHIFSYEELKEATSCFKQQIGDGGFSSVYLGKLPDQRIVAVKVLYEGIPKRFEQFINEVTVLSRLRHKNLVVLYGCTDPETKKLLLVYEFMPNGTIADHLHGKRPPLTWAVRIQMAIETAEALAYLHSLEPPIIHRDVKTSNILLDNDFHVKVADLGMCRLLPWDSKSVTTQPQGTQGYRDPEYELYCNLTDKSDVYSFGVVLLELLSGQEAVDVNREKNDIYLFRMALNMILNKELEQLVDPKLVYHSDCEIKRMIDLVAELACNCLQPEADMRPSMLDVVSALKKIYNDM